MEVIEVTHHHKSVKMFLWKSMFTEHRDFYSHVIVYSRIKKETKLQQNLLTLLNLSKKLIHCHKIRDVSGKARPVTTSRIASSTPKKKNPEQ